MRSTRLSQTISPFGVGAILDIEGESLMAMDVSRWDVRKTTRIESRRVEAALGVAELRSPPSVPATPSVNSPGLLYMRFPSWLFCQDCRRMHRVRMTEESGASPRCLHCGGYMVPMRFIVVGTERGHAMDVPWVLWAHSEAESDEQGKCRDQENLLFKTRTGGTEGLASLVVHCGSCHARRHLGDLLMRDSLRRVGFRCLGSQPWQSRSAGGCDERVEVLQRGATNVTISETTTALDIPEPTMPVRDVESEIRQHKNFTDVQSAPTGPMAEVLVQLICRDLGVTPEVVLRVVAQGLEPDDEIRAAREGLMADEWLAFQQAIDHPEEPVGNANFQVSATTLVGGHLNVLAALTGSHFGSVVLAHRLREIRVLQGFRRYDLAADLVDVDLGPRGRERWLPAVESFGEGVLITFDEERLSSWESNESVRKRAATLERRRRQSPVGSRHPEASPRLILLHTFAHLLMRQLSFSCGYSAASLRERVYAGSGPRRQAGVLVYTAAGDSEGTLGGLVRQGEPPRLLRSIYSMLQDAWWCSNDPLCRESRGQGLDSMNLAACHGCCLVSETSCERSNLLLDRVLLVGDDGQVPGYLEEVMASLQRHAAEAVDRTACGS